jgi:hypothetical protein
MTFFFFSAAKDKGRDFIAALAESLSCLYYFVDWLRSCTSAANENQKRPNGRKLLNRIIRIIEPYPLKFPRVL